MKTLLFTAVKDEGPYILEWLAYYKALGFSDFLIIQNDSTDGTKEILHRLHDMGEIQFLNNDNPSGAPQLTACKLAADTELYKSANWVAYFDCDEYLNVGQSIGINSFLSEFEEFEALAINWLNFGDSGNLRWGAGLTIERFNRCAPPEHSSNLHFKSIHRPFSEKFNGFGVHRPWPKRSLDSFVYTDKRTVEGSVQLGRGPTHLAILVIVIVWEVYIIIQLEVVKNFIKRKSVVTDFILQKITVEAKNLQL